MNFNFKFYWSLFLRRLPVMMALLLICSTLGVVTALKLPPTYSASARLLVEAPQIPNDMVASTVRVDAAEQLQVIEQRLLTRANLIDIANKFRVFSNLSEMTPDDVAAAMKQNTRIRRTSGRNEATLMTLKFEASRARVAADVINEYVTLILEANNRFRLSRAEDTLNFFEQEVGRIGTELDQQSARIVEFKNANANALPDDLNYRLDRQTLLQERLGRLERDRVSVLKQRSEIVAIFQATGRVQPEEETQMSPQERKLAALKLELEQALAIYSETNPNVRLLQGRIDQLEESIRAGQVATGPATDDSAPASLLDVTLAEIDTRLEDIDREIAETTEELRTLAQSIAATSGNAIALNSLERDYDNIQRQYDEAVRNLNDARMGERIEVTSQGQRITIIEGASVPQEPSGPNRPVIAATGIAAGLGLAAGFFVLLEILNRTIRRPSELQSRFDIVPIATIPYMESRRERFARRAVLVTAFLAVLIGVPAGLWYIDTTYMPLELLADKIIAKLGFS